MSSQNHSFFGDVLRHVDRAAAYTKHPVGLLEQIKRCNSIYQFEFPLRQSDGSVEVISAWRDNLFAQQSSPLMMAVLARRRCRTHRYDYLWPERTHMPDKPAQGFLLTPFPKCRGNALRIEKIKLVQEITVPDAEPRQTIPQFGFAKNSQRRAPLCPNHVAATFPSSAVNVRDDDSFPKRIMSKRCSHTGLIIRMRKDAQDISLQQFSPLFRNGLN
jgi:hypothetical protein